MLMLSGVAPIKQVLAAPGVPNGTPTGQAIIINAAAAEAGVLYCWDGGNTSGLTHGGWEWRRRGLRLRQCLDGRPLLQLAGPSRHLSGIGREHRSSSFLHNAGQQGADYASYGGTLITSQSDLERGDIVFLGGGSLSAAAHDAIYAGGGTRWHFDTAYSWNGGSYPNGVMNAA